MTERIDKQMFTRIYYQLIVKIGFVRRGWSLKEYSETKFDNDDSDPPLLYVFGKMINNKLVYIKLKIRNNKRKCVICISFHYARDKMDFPYA